MHVLLNFLTLLVFLLYVSHRHSGNKVLSLNKIITKTHQGIMSTEMTARKLHIMNTTKIVANNGGSRNTDPDFVWKKYGREHFDWALIVNAWLCVRRNKPNETILVVYSGAQLNVTKVSTNLQDLLK